jgi:hypothetical protein
MSFPYGRRPNVELLMDSYPHLRPYGVAGEVFAQLQNEGEDRASFRTAHKILQGYEDKNHGVYR